jgi:D-alanyl-D-alanine carboxypeptidase
MSGLPIHCRRRTITRLCLPSVFVYAFVVTPADAQLFSPCGAPNPPPMSAAATEESTRAPTAVEKGPLENLQDLYRNVPHEGASGVAVLAVRDGQVLFKGAYGLANRQNQTKVTLSTRFAIGSITKQFTAAAIMKLREQGRLTLGDRLAKYFPSIPSGSEITLAQVLGQNSGIHDILDRQFAADFHQAISRDRILEVIQERPLDFAPGTRHRYSNAGYLLLGQIIEKVSGEPFEQYLRQEFFQPLRMNDTGLYDVDRDLPGMARGYQWNGQQLDQITPFHASLTLSSGGLYSTVEDLTRWGSGPRATPNTQQGKYRCNDNGRSPQ